MKDMKNVSLIHSSCLSITKIEFSPSWRGEFFFSKAVLQKRDFLDVLLFAQVRHTYLPRYPESLPNQITMMTETHVEGSWRRNPSAWDEDIGDLDFFGLICKLRRIEEHHSHEPLKDPRVRLLIMRAIDEVQRLVGASSLTRDSSGANLALAEFDLDEIQFGPMLGSGGFADVYEISGFRPHSSKEYAPDVQAARDFLIEHARSQSTGECRFALKHLRRSLVYDPEKLAREAVDLAMEAHVMAALDHENILKIRGVAAAGLNGLVGGRFDEYFSVDEYFIIVDKLSETLEERIDTWKNQLKRLKCLSRLRPFGRTKRDAKRKKLLLEQLQVAYEVSTAISYLHSKGVVHRDIKTSNIGFDARGVCKLFDFGLSTEIRSGDDGLPCQLSESVGSPNYMAPEVAKCEAYDSKADVYSYAKTLYEILSLSLPWEKKPNKKKTCEILSLDDEAPSISSSWPVAIQVMLERAWSPKSSERPPMSEICDILCLEIEKLQVGDSSGPIKKPAACRRSSLSTYLASLNEFMAGREGLPEQSVNTDTTRGTASTSHHHSM